MKVFKQDITNYYKYVYSDYSLPTMTSTTAPEGSVASDITKGNNGSNIYPLFFDGADVTIDCYAGNTSTSRYIKYTFKYKLAAGDYEFGYSGHAQKNVKMTENKWVAIYEDGSTVQIMNNLFTSTEQTFTASFTATKPIKAIQLNITAKSSSNQYCNTNLTGLALKTRGYSKNVVKVIKSNTKGYPEDHDFFQKKTAYKTFAFPSTKYYKFTSWTQPTLTANGTMGISNFACYANRSYNATPVNVYQAFSPNTGYIASYKSLAYSTLYIYFQSINALKITKFVFSVPIKNSNNDTQGGHANDLKLEGFNSKTNKWEQIGYIQGGTYMGNKTHTMDLSSNTKYYKLFRFQGTTGGGGHHDEIDISGIQITAQQVVECKKGEHDFYEEDLIYKAIP